jgi:hypothetical protein
LILRNTDSENSVTAKVTLFSLDGEQKKTVNLDLAPNAASRLAIANVFDTQGQSDSIQSGSLSVEYTSRGKLVLMGQVVIENEKQGIIFDLHLQSGYTFDSEKALFAPWWLADEDTDGTIVLCNSTSGNVVVSSSLSTAGRELPAKDVVLAPHETKQLSLRGMLAAVGLENTAQGALTVRYTGALRSLQPALLLANTKTGFSLSPEFNAKHAQPSAQQPPKTTIWRFPDVILSPDAALGFDKNNPVTAYALLSNGTNSVLAPQLQAIVDESNGAAAAQPVEPVSLLIEPLQPGETRLVDLSALAEATHISKTVSHFALTATHGGAPGDLGITVFSVGENQNFVFRAEGSIRRSQVVFSSYWDVGDDLTALLAVQNASEDPVQTEATLYYQTKQGPGTYTLPPLDLAGNGVRILNLKEAILSKVPDKNGNVIPTGTTFGTLTLATVGKKHRGILGGSTSFDALRGGYGAPIGGPDGCCVDEFDCITEGFTDPAQDPNCDVSDPMPDPVGSGGGGGAPPATPRIDSIDPTFLTAGDNNKSLTIHGVGFGTSPIVHLPSGATSAGQASSDATIVLTSVSISTSAQIGVNNITVSAGAVSSSPAPFTIDGPDHMVVIDDQVATCSGCTTAVARFMTYRVIKFNLSPANAIPIGEVVSTSDWNCGGAFPGVVTTSCAAPVQTQTQSDGSFTDLWTLSSDSFSPAGCGDNIVDHWQWCSAPKTVGTLSGYVHTNAININGSIRPPGPAMTGTVVVP